MEEFFPHVRELPAEAAFELLQSDPVCGGGLRGNQVRHGLCLGEVHLPVQEGTLGEFARCGHFRPALHQQREDPGDDVIRSVAGDFDGILTRIGVRGAKYGNDHFVEQAAVMVPDFAIMEGIARRL